MLPGDGVDTTTFRRTLDKVNREWQSDKIWGWDFPMMAMGAARSGNPELALDMRSILRNNSSSTNTAWLPAVRGLTSLRTADC